MDYNRRMLAAIVGGAAAVSPGPLCVGADEGPALAAGFQMTLGATTTETTPLASSAVATAAPTIEGPVK